MILLAKSVTPFVLPDTQIPLLKTQARIGATPSSTTDESWAVTAWSLVEQWTQRLWLRGSSDYREGTYEVEVVRGDGDLPMMLTAKNTPGVTVQSMMQWDEDLDTPAYAAYTDWKPRPANRWRPDEFGTYKLVVRATPDETLPGGVVQGAARIASWLKHYAPADVKSDGVGGTVIPVSVAGAVMRSGAAEALFPWR